MSPKRNPMAVLDTLTDKQREVLTYVADGLTSKEIARKLDVSESAVNQRIESIRQRLGGMPRSQIARMHRLQSTVVMTIPTSNSLTGNPIALQSGPALGQVTLVEGVAEPAAPSAQQAGDMLQPSTIFPRLETALSGPNGAWFRLAAIVGLAGATAVITLVVVAVMHSLDGLLMR